MLHFGYIAWNRLGLVTKADVKDAIKEQWQQELSHDGNAQQIGRILQERGLLSSGQIDQVLRYRVMEPNIPWDESTFFARRLLEQKEAKQRIGDYVGQKWCTTRGATLFLSDSSTAYYAFRGLMKHDAVVTVLTINAAILSAYPAVRSQIQKVETVWKGHVDLDNALIQPPDLSEATKASLTQRLNDGGVKVSLIPTTGFDARYGPMGQNSTAIAVARWVLQAERNVWILMDHSKVRVGTPPYDHDLLFHGEEWDKVLEKRLVKVVVTRHPCMPKELSNLPISSRTVPEIRRLLGAAGQSQSIIDEVATYQDWAMKVRDYLEEVPY